MPKEALENTVKTMKGLEKILQTIKKDIKMYVKSGEQKKYYWITATFEDCTKELLATMIVSEYISWTKIADMKIKDLFLSLSANIAQKYLE